MEPKNELKNRIGFFDSDCLEWANEQSLRSRVLPEFGIRKRMQSKIDKLEKLFNFAKEHDIVQVFTHCCSAQPVQARQHPEVVVVPRDIADQSWQAALAGRRLINIEKIHNSPLNHSFICRHFDMFQHNSNAMTLLKKLNIPTWILFGHGFDLCVDSAAKGIIAAGFHVHFLTDVTAPSASGYGPYGTPESGKAILDYLVKIGMTTGTWDAFLQNPEQPVASTSSAAVSFH